MNKQTIYLAGGIAGLTDDQCNNWRDYATKKLKDKFNLLNPMRRDYRGQEDENVDSIVEGDYDDIANSDIVLANACKPSWGTAMEIHHAFQEGKIVFVITEEKRVSPWLRYHSEAIFETLDDAIDSLEEIA